MKHLDESYIEALLLHGGVYAVAEQLAVAPSTVYRRLKDDDFKAKLEAARKDCFTVAMVAIHGKMSVMLKKLEYLTDHGTKNDTVKLAAIKAWLDLGSKHREADIEQALFDLEKERKNVTA